MKKVFDQTGRYFIFLLIVFYAFDLVFYNNTGLLWFYLLVLIYPMSILTASAIQTYKKGTTWYLFLYAPVIFLPILFLQLNSSANVYLLVYAFCTMIGQFVGNSIRQLKH